MKNIESSKKSLKKEFQAKPESKCLKKKLLKKPKIDFRFKKSLLGLLKQNEALREAEKLKWAFST